MPQSGQGPSEEYVDVLKYYPPKILLLTVDQLQAIGEGLVRGHERHYFGYDATYSGHDYHNG